VFRVAPELPAGTVTILFSDVEGSTSLTARRGDLPAHDLLNAQRELVRGQIEKHSGYEVKSMGDGFMVAFGSARLAISCAMAMQRALYEHNLRQPADDRIAVRIGLNTGEVISQDEDLYGETVNVASRVAAKAKGGEIFISEAVRMVLARAPDIELVDRGRFRLKGIPERRRLYEIRWKDDALTGHPALSDRTPFVARDAELAELRRQLDRTSEGHGGLAMISGEPGVGKTRIAEELLAEARDRGMVGLIGHSRGGEGALPYEPFVEMLEQATQIFEPEALRTALGESAPEVAKLLPELRRALPSIPLPPELPPEQERRYLFNGMRDFLARASQVQPLVLILDDLQWGDDGTLLLLQHIAEQLDRQPIMIVATYRDTDLDGGRPFAHALEELVRQRLTRQIRLQRLAETSVARMLQGMSGQEPPASLAAVIHRETDGNPFFVEEVIHHLAQEERLFDAAGGWRSDVTVGELEVPETVRLVTTRRLERVSDQCKRLLSVAAVIGRDFTFRVLETTSDLSTDALLDAVDEAERAHLVTSTEEGPEARLAFTHELVRQTLLSTLSAARRQRLHLQVADAMERASSFAEQEAAPNLAYHLREAGGAADEARTARYATLAGDRALSAAAYEDALRHYETALSTQPPSDRGARANLLYKRGMTLLSLGRGEDALADWRAALTLYEALRDFPAVGHVSATISHQLLWGTRFIEALELSLRGLRSIGTEMSRDRCILLASAGVTLSLAGFYEAADEMIGNALRVAETLRDQEALAIVLGHKAVHHFCHAQIREQADAGQRTVELLRTSGNLWDLADALWVTQLALWGLGRLDEVEAIGEELEPLAIRIGHAGATMFAGRTRAYRELVLNANLEQYEAFTRADLDLCQRAEFPALSQSFTFSGLAQFLRGRWPEAIERLEDAVADEAPGIYTGLDWGMYFVVKAYAGGRDGSVHKLLRKKRAAAPSEMTSRRMASLTFQLIRTANASGLRLRMFWQMFRTTRRTKMKDYLPRSGHPNGIGSWVLLLSVVEGEVVSGNPDRAARLYPLVLDCIEQSGSVMRFPEPRLTQTTAGIAAAAGRRWQQAEEHFQLAMRQAEELPHRLEQPEVRRFYARMLLDRGESGDREKARTLLSIAIAKYHEIGMPKHEEMAQALLHEAS
jgi:class 3 adenylate cyclase/tetratricopeptide (TPR) repeat protein